MNRSPAESGVLVIREFSFDAMTGREVHDVLRLRAEVFVVEQTCVFQDPDDADLVARHLLFIGRGGRLIGYARWHEEGGCVRFGRVIVAREFRGRGLGRRLIEEGLERIGPRPVQVHAQAHLERYYAAFGFVRQGDAFMEDGIPHVRMDRAAPAAD